MRMLFVLLTFPVSIPIMILLRDVDRLEEKIESYLPRLPRFINWIWAVWGAYFWLPCPICGRNFGGHESSCADLMTSWAGGEMVCWQCGEEANKRSEAFMEANPPPVHYY